MKHETLEISEMMIQRFEAEYPILDVRAEVMRMKNWWLANPRKRKEPKGEYRFAVNWLNAEYAKTANAAVKARIGANVGKFDPGQTQSRVIYSASTREYYASLGIKV